MSFFFFQAEDGIRDLVRSRGLGDVYKRQVLLTIMAMLLLVQKFKIKFSTTLIRHLLPLVYIEVIIQYQVMGKP